MVFRSALSLVFALLALCAEAQSITTLEQLTFQPTILAAKGVVTSCGVRFSGLAMQPGTKTGVDVVDGSIAIHSQGYTLVKAGFKTGDLAAGAEKLRLAGKKVAWVRIEGGKSLAPMGNKIIDADDPGFHMFGAPLADGLAALDALLADKKFWIGFSGATGQDKIFSGAVRMDERTRDEFSSCLGELVATMKGKR
ncbi:hypothetical protein J2W28_006438 [Variovorax boronicumulans]|uniref:hypothetical protein n=1 Tax=Variovorax boronicumulans TaxID=436515 RepID=UPI00278B93D7|nr:hypothetical protein [Variovorax boronicumulans]MDP9995494.1 hypothetical protein [Variovorax boronicumulans]MDQ0007263.1 hypothetical protein [Variovorax boronicumulans]